jgi:hypothetical protein
MHRIQAVDFGPLLKTSWRSLYQILYFAKIDAGNLVKFKGEQFPLLGTSSLYLSVLILIKSSKIS